MFSSSFRLFRNTIPSARVSHGQRPPQPVRGGAPTGKPSGFHRAHSQATPPFPRTSDGCIPQPLVLPIVTHVLSTYGRVLHIAPRSTRWEGEAPKNMSFLSTPTKDELIRAIRQQKPQALVVGDQPIDEDTLLAWRAACPGQELVLLRRGSSTDKIRRDVCALLNIQVKSLPGVNAIHVARYVAKHAMGADRLCVLGCGKVGAAVVDEVCRQNPGVRVAVPTHQRTSLAELGLTQHAARVNTTAHWDEGLRGAQVLVVSVPVTDKTTHALSAARLASLQSGARVVCVSKPDVFDDEALRWLARSDLRLHLDYGPDTLAAFRERASRLGCPLDTWKLPPRLSSEAATGIDCKNDLDLAAAFCLASLAVLGFAAKELRQPMAIPSAPLALANAPQVHVLGRGINGLFQALWLVLGQRCQVTVHGGTDIGDGASHKPVNMRHLSLTETTAKNVYANPEVFGFAQEFVVALNRCGLELFRQLLVDNPSLQGFAREPLVRAYPMGQAGIEASVQFQRDISEAPWPSGQAAPPVESLSGDEFERRFQIPGIQQAVVVPGIDLGFRDFMGQLCALLTQAGVRFVDARPSPESASSPVPRDAQLISARGVEEHGVTPVLGWFVKLPAADGEGMDVRGIKLQYELPIGVMNCRRDGEYLLVSGGQVPPGATAQEQEAIQQQVLGAVARHFPASYQAAVASGRLEVLACARPGTQDGVSRVEWMAPGQLLVGGTYAGGTTQAAILAALAQALLQAGRVNGSLGLPPPI